MACFSVPSSSSGGPSADNSQETTQLNEEPTQRNEESTQLNTKRSQSSMESTQLNTEPTQLNEEPTQLIDELAQLGAEPTQLNPPEYLRALIGNHPTVTLDWNKLSILSLPDMLETARVIIHPKIGGVFFTPYGGTDSFNQWIEVTTDDHLEPARVLVVAPKKQQIGCTVTHLDICFHIFFGAVHHPVAFFNQSGHTISIARLRQSRSHKLLPRQHITVPVGHWTITAKGQHLFEIKILKRVDQPTTSRQPIKRATPTDETSSKRRKISCLQEAMTSRFTTQDIPPLAVPKDNALVELEEGMSIHVGSAEEGYRLTHLGTIYENEQSSVWRAQHSGFPGREVVVKVIKVKGSNSKSIIHAAMSWMSEVAIHSSMDSHTAIVPLMDFDARFFSLYTEYIDAKPLSRHMGPNLSFNGSLSDARSIIRDIAAALSVAHAKGIVHGDIKPANVLYSSSRGAVTIDFGLGFQCDDPRRCGGTPWYLPPEYMEDWGLRQTGADIWALGVIMLWVLGHICFPDKSSRCWQIADIHPDGPPTASHQRALDTMTDWLNYIREVRSHLRDDDELESIISETLETSVGDRIDAAALCQRLDCLRIPDSEGNAINNHLS
ncbi:hypothetical protein E0Z10_g10871 [Xylaria hypoxylon]|uniref:Autophagy-related protein 1 n=1 Tax=Xylaria hypoxylon TaxID=37992 RepID=A0A4Z0YAB4_9PEZI|nr:hypothetical protein E0Z10_g10871 [Xylaria hypoxylon]